MSGDRFVLSFRPAAASCLFPRVAVVVAVILIQPARLVPTTLPGLSHSRP
jgi:hypothetical protein